jgi:thiol-disulfide isomerase/thioredoxin
MGHSNFEGGRVSERRAPGTSLFSPLLWLLSLAGSAIICGCGPTEMPEVKLDVLNYPTGAEVNPCSKKERCLITFVTPWCPSCQAATEFIQAARKKINNGTNVGMMVIVGQDERASILGHARKIDGLVFLDYDNKFSAAVRVGSVPHWWVIDKSRKIQSSGAGLPTTEDRKVVDYFLDSQFGLKDYL